MEQKLDDWLDQRLGKWVRYSLIALVVASAAAGVAYASVLGRLTAEEKESARLAKEVEPLHELQGDMRALQEKLESTEKQLDNVLGELQRGRR